jgi:hypothetical protein
VILPEVDLEIAFFYLHSIHALQFVIDRRDQAFDFDPVTIPDCFINVSKAIETVQLIHPPECRRFVNAFLCELSRVASYPEGKFDLQWAIRIFALILTTDKVIFEIYNFPPDKHFSGYKPFEMAQEQIDLWWERTAPEEGEA